MKDCDSVPTHFVWTVTCPGCGCTFTRRATTPERETRPTVGEPMYGADLERVAYCLACRVERQP
jgi:hypothetical protein